MKRKRFLNAMASLYLNFGLSGSTLHVPTAACCRIFSISVSRFFEWNWVSASRKIKISREDFFAPRFLALDTLRSFMLRTRAYFFAIVDVESVHPLQTTIISASCGSDWSVASM